MLDDRVVKRLVGMVLAKLELLDDEFVSAKQLYGAGLEMKDADPERRAPHPQSDVSIVREALWRIFAGSCAKGTRSSSGRKPGCGTRKRI